MNADAGATSSPPVKGIMLQAVTGDGPVTVNRSASGSPLWASMSKPSTERVTARVRAKLQQLPAWDPLPPGEIQVRRPGGL